MDGSTPGRPVPRIEDLVFVGFNSRAAALDRYDGRIVWSWKAPQGSGFVALLLDGDRLIASVQGYTYCLDPLTGVQVWANPMSGFGLGVPSIASANGSTSHPVLGEAQEEQSRENAAASGRTH